MAPVGGPIPSNGMWLGPISGRNAVICTDTDPIGLLSIEFWCANEHPTIALIRRDLPPGDIPGHSLSLETADGSVFPLSSEVSDDQHVIWLRGEDSSMVVSAVFSGRMTAHLPELSATYAISDGDIRLLRHLRCLNAEP